MFLLETIRKLFDKTKLESSIVRYASCLNPSNLTTLVSSWEPFKLLINQLVYRNILLAKTGGRALSQFSVILNCVKVESEKVTFFKLKKQWIGNFYFNCLTNISEKKELRNVLKLIFAIIHGQADVEREFTLNKQKQPPEVFCKKRCS